MLRDICVNDLPQADDKEKLKGQMKNCTMAPQRQLSLDIDQQILVHQQTKKQVTRTFDDNPDSWDSDDEKMLKEIMAF